jgi:hypothetical protein
VVAWDDGLAAFTHALGQACTECDAKHVQAEAAYQDFLAQMHASSSRFKQLHHLSQMLEECRIPLCLQGTDLEVLERYWRRSSCAAFIPSMGDIYRWN